MPGFNLRQAQPMIQSWRIQKRCIHKRGSNNCTKISGLIDDRFQSQGSAGISDVILRCCVGKTAHFPETADQNNTHRSLCSVNPDGTFVSNVLDKEPVIRHSLKL
jgi:hypothetical protein